VSTSCRKLTWVLVGWTAAAIGVGVLARFTFAAPVPSGCPPGVDSSSWCGPLSLRPLWYFLIALVWLVVLGAIVLIDWRRAEGPPESPLTFLLETADGAPANPRSIETAARRSWHPGDKIRLSRKTLRVIGVRYVDDQPTVLIVEDTSV